MAGKKRLSKLTSQRRTALLLILWRLPEFITSLIAATASGSVVVWLEFVENASILTPGILLAILSRRLKKNLKFKYNYGTGKVEAITALCCEIFDIAGLFCVTFFAIKGLIKPEIEETEYLLIALYASIIGVLIDLVILTRQKKIIEGSGSKMFHTAYVSAQKEFFFDIASIITLAISIIFKEKEWIHYFSPVVCLIIVVPFFGIVTHHIKGSIAELIDLTLDEESQLKILKVLTEFYDEYKELGEVKSRVNGSQKHIDIELLFHDDTTFGEIHKTCENIRRRILEELGPGTVNIVIL